MVRSAMFYGLPLRAVLSVVVLTTPARSWTQSEPALPTDARLSVLINRLTTAKEPRARLTAALALGPYGDPASVPALCAALSDEEQLVRIASAKALDQIGDITAIGCLERATGAAATTDAIATALSSLKRLREQEPWLYVRLAAVDNRAGLTHYQVALLEDRLKKRLVRKGAILAPADETPAAAAKQLAETKLRGVMVTATVEKYDAGLSLRLAVVSYPEKQSIGHLAFRAKTGPVEAAIQALVPKAVDECTSALGSGLEGAPTVVAVSDDAQAVVMADDHTLADGPSKTPRGAMEKALLYAHSWFRWLLNLVGLAALLRALLTLASKRPWTDRDRAFQVAFIVALDVQVIFGTVLWFVSPNRMDSAHATIAVFSLLVVHAVSAIAGKTTEPIRRAQLWAYAAITGFTLLLAANLWPGAHDAPLFRLL